MVESLVLQLQGVADCLLSLPFSELAAAGGPLSSPASQSDFPVFSGPPLANSSGVAASDVGLDVEQSDEGTPAVPGDASAATSATLGGPCHLTPWGILGIGLLGSRDGSGTIMWVLGLVLSLDPVHGSFFSPNASGSEEEVEPANVPEEHRPGGMGPITGRQARPRLYRPVLLTSLTRQTLALFITALFRLTLTICLAPCALFM